MDASRCRLHPGIRFFFLSFFPFFFFYNFFLIYYFFVCLFVCLFCFVLIEVLVLDVHWKVSGAQPFSEQGQQKSRVNTVPCVQPEVSRGVVHNESLFQSNNNGGVNSYCLCFRFVLSVLFIMSRCFSQISMAMLKMNDLP